MTEKSVINNEVDILHGNTSSDISLSANLENLSNTGLSRGDAIELGHIPAMEDDDLIDDADDDPDNTDDDTDDDVDNECEPQPYISDESD